MKVLGLSALALIFSIESIALALATTGSHNRENPGVTDTSVSGIPSSTLGPASRNINIIWRVGEEVNTPEQRISLNHLNGISQLWGHYRGYLILSLGPVVQWLEHPSLVQRVVGSSPTGPAQLASYENGISASLRRSGKKLNPRYFLPSMVRVLEMPHYTGVFRCIFPSHKFSDPYICMCNF